MIRVASNPSISGILISIRIRSGWDCSYIFVQSEEGHGSIFKFTIPYQRITIETDINDMENNEIKENVSMGRTILVAEDVESNFLLLKAIIGKTYTLLHAWNGKEAVEMFPPIFSTSILHIANPKPEPCTKVFNFVKRSKIVGTLSLGIPHPESST